MKTKLFLSISIAFISFFVKAQIPCNASFTYTTTSTGVNITNTSTGVDQNTYYRWNYPVDNDTVFFIPLYNGTYIITLDILTTTTSSSSSSSSCGGSDTQVVTINGGQPAPACVASFSYTLGNNGNIKFTNTSPVDPYGLTNYYWKFNSLYSTSNASDTVIRNFYYNGTYTVSLSSYNDYNKCYYPASTQTIAITNAQPHVTCNSNFTYTVGTAGQVNFTSLYAGTAPNISYTWDFGDAGFNSGSGSNTSFTYLYNNTYVVTHTIRDSIYCNSSTVDTIIINTAQPLPPCQANFSYTMGNSGQVSFSNISDTSTITPNIFIWELGNSGYPSSTIPTYTFAYNGTYSVSLLLYNYDAYCQNITTQTITVTNAAPSPCLVLNANFSYILSSNGYVNFSSTSTGIDTSSYYVWNFGDGTSFNYNTLSADTAITYFNNGIYSVYLEVTRNYLFNPDSLNQHATCYDTISIPITINNIPVCNASFTYSLGTNGQVSFYAASSGLSYNWSFGDAIGSASNVPNPSFIYHSNGTYTVFLQIQDSAGYFCGSSQAINIVNTNSCTPYVTYSLQQDTVPFTWDAYPYYSSQVASAIWYWGDGSSTTGLYTSHTYSSQGTYNICVKVFSSCGDSTTTCQNDSIYRLSSINTMIKVNIINSASTGISTVSKEDISLTIFPNPASNNIQIITSNNNSDIKFIDMLGQTVKHLSTKTQETTVDISNLMDGVYFVIITENGLNTSKRIIIYK